MSPAVIALALTAALLHATWNAALRSGADRLSFVTAMAYATTAIAIPVVLLLPLPLPGCWLYLLLSAALQVVYIIFLAQAYRYGELGQVYPVVRGSVPLLVTAGGFVLAGQRLTAAALLGVGLISLGIISLALGRGRGERKSLSLALLAALFVASYVMADALGVRLAGNPQSYAAWNFLAYGALLPVAFRLLRGGMALKLPARETLKAVAAGILSFGSYAAIITAFAIGNVGSITALRETSIVFSALIGRVLLGEALTVQRILVCLTVTLGAVCIGYS
ncbi:MAG TPA: EamA family transporter [Steroidobacteraceae bacterium]|nr:EamA family transporter [Steroidobacteraceae bacterium]